MPFLRFRHPTLAERAQLESTNETREISAATLGEAIAVAEQILAATIIPHDEGKGFRVGLKDQPPEKHILVDIHIHRKGDWFCPKHDLGVALLPDDIVFFEMLVC